MAMGCPLEGSLTAARGEDSTEGHLLQCVPTIQLCRDALRVPLRSENWGKTLTDTPECHYLLLVTYIQES